MDEAEMDLVVLGSTPEDQFNRSWSEGLLSGALEELEQTLTGRDRKPVFEVFHEYCLGSADQQEPSYRDIA